MKNPTLGPIQQSTLTDEVTSRLRDAIITGQLAPGEKLAEGALAAQMGVSRSPVREALHRLEREGVVIRQTSRASTVWEPCETDVDEIIELRNMLEWLAYRLVITNLTERDFVQLDAILERYAQAVVDLRLVDAIREDRRFHEYICIKSDQSRLIDFWQQIMTQWEVLNYIAARYGSRVTAERVIVEHRSISDVLRQRDLAEASAKLRAHCESSRRWLKEALRSIQPSR
jgi:DNA-binding GntR family transcriptional regulator